METNIYLIEDQLVIRKFLKKFLTKNFKCHIKEFSNANDTIDELQSETTLPDLIISDIMMPGGSGLLIKKYLEKRHLKVPTIFVTALSGEEIHEENFSILSKPINDKELHEKIISHLE